MKNTKMSPTKGDKVEALCREILRKPGGTFFFEGRKAELWEEASDDFSQQWKEIAAEKYEVECMVNLMYDLILREEIKRKGKIVLDIKRRATSMVK